MKPYFDHSLIKYSRQDPHYKLLHSNPTLYPTFISRYIHKYHDLDNILLYYVTLKCWEHVIKIMNAVHLLLLKWEQAGVFFPRWYHETWRDCFDGKTQSHKFFMVLEKPFSFCLKQAER